MRKYYSLLAILAILIQIAISEGRSNNLNEIGFFNDLNEPLWGNYNIGSGGDYLTLNDAVTDLNTYGVSGPVVFQLLSGIYNEQVVLGPIVGASEVNTITFESETGNAEDVMITFEATDPAENYVILLDDASHIAFRNMTVEAASAELSTTFLAINGLYDLLIEDCRVISPLTTLTTTIVNNNNIFLQPSESGNVRLINNFVNGGSTGLFYSGGEDSNFMAEGTVVTGNTVSDARVRGISLQRQSGFLLSHNIISMRELAVTNITGLLISECSGPIQVLANRISNTRTYGMYFGSCSAFSQEPALIANNFVSSTAGTGLFLQGLNSNLRFYHNSVNNLGNGTALFYNGNGSSNNAFLNNSFSAQSGSAIQVSQQTSGFQISNYNNLYSGGANIGRWLNVDAADIFDWRQRSGKDQNSISFDPLYDSGTELYANSPALANSGTQLAEVPTDIDGLSRKVIPSIGAAEFDAEPLVPLSGIYTINPNESGERNFLTLHDAMQAMLDRGINSSVVFRLANGTHQGNVEIPRIFKASAGNTVTIESASENAEEVVITYGATLSSNNYVVQLKGASGVILRNLTIQATGTSFARTLTGINDLSNILVEGCVLTSTQTSSTNINAGNVVLLPTASSAIRFHNNLISGGTSGIHYIGTTNNQLRAFGAELVENTIVDFFLQGTFIQRTQNLKVKDNTITARATSSTGSDGIALNTATGAIEVLGNRVSQVNRFALHLATCFATPEAPGLIANNFLSSRQGNTGASLYTVSISHQRIFHNNTYKQGSGSGFYYHATTGVTGNILRNNIFSSQSGYAIRVQDARGFESSDYNNLYTGGANIGRWLAEVDSESLADWQDVSGHEANSLAVDPEYSSLDELYASASLLSNAGIAIPEVNTDIDGNPRKSNPSIGANEYGDGAPVGLAGLYTINPAGEGERNFVSFTSAVQALVENSISDAIIFEVAEGTYQEQLTIPLIFGTSAEKTVTFISESGQSDDVVITFNAGSAADNFVVHLNGAQHLIFSNLTIEATGESFSRTIFGTGNITNILVESCRILSPVVTSSDNNRNNIQLEPETSSQFRFVSNLITGGSTAVSFTGGTALSFRAAGVEFSNNILDAFFRGFTLSRMQSVIVRNNTIVVSEVPLSSDGISLSFGDGSTNIENNRISGVRRWGIYMVNSFAESAEPGLIANNFISGRSVNLGLIELNGVSYQRFYHNSLRAAGIGIRYTGITGSAGNMFINNNIQATSLAINVINASGFNSSEYNNLFTSAANIGQWLGTSTPSLSDWQDVSGQDINSISFNPQYTSETELYATAPALANAGTPLDAVTNDIDGFPRKNTPSIGANEFDADPLVPLAGAYTINPEGEGDRNFTTWASAIDALNINGVSADVTFMVADGTYEEQVEIPAINGVSETNTITFESASGNPENVILTHDSNDPDNNYVIRLNNTRHFKLRNLTLHATNTTYGRNLQGSGVLENISVEGSRLISPTTTTASNTLRNIAFQPVFSSGIRLVGNTIIGGSSGIYFIGSNSSNTRAAGLEIQNNEILGSYHYAVEIQQTEALRFEDNIIDIVVGSSTNSVGLYIVNSDGAQQITGNTIIRARNYGIYILGSTAQDDTPGLIANNFISGSLSGGAAIYILGQTAHQQVYHNNLNNTASTGSVLLYNGSNQAAGNRIVNNIFRGGSFGSFVINVTSAIGLVESDYNNLFSTGQNIGQWLGTNTPGLGEWQAASGQDANSLNLDPKYVSFTDLTPQETTLVGEGKDLTTVVADDIFGNPRTAPVSIGAVELQVDGVVDIAVTAILSPESSCSLSDEEVTVVLTNNGTELVSGIELAYSVNNEDPVVETTPGGQSVGPGQTLLFTFQTLADLSEKGEYSIRVFLTEDDADNANNELSLMITHYPDLVVEVSDDAVICEGQSLELTAGGGTAYLWSAGATTSSILVSPTATTTYTVIVSNDDGCSEEASVLVTVAEPPLLEYVGDNGFSDSFVAPRFGTDETEFSFRVMYTDASGAMPAAGYPRVELDSNNNNDVNNPNDVVVVMTEEDPSDTNVTNGKIYIATVSNLSDQISWRSRITVQTTEGCLTSTPFVSSPILSDDLLDIAIFANDISFSNSNPALNEVITIFARVNNLSDFPAENFVVSAYIEDEQIYTTTIELLKSKSNMTLSWPYSFSEAGFYQVKVIIDETEVLDEVNKLNNFAIRPVLTGDFELPGGIEISAAANKASYFPEEIIRISGYASYFGIEEGVNPDVVGATVVVNMETRPSRTVNTFSNGNFDALFIAPATPGQYLVTGSITDFTLSASIEPFFVTVVEAPPLPDLTSSIVLDNSTIISGEQAGGVATVSNAGNATAMNFIFRYWYCEGVLGEELIESLAPGESLSFPFTAQVTATGDCFNTLTCLFSAFADYTLVVEESRENNNGSNRFLTVLPNLPDLTPQMSIAPFSFNSLTTPFGINVRIHNIGGVVAVGNFNVNVYVDGDLIDSRTFDNLASCSNINYSVPFQPTEPKDYLVSVSVDEPIGSGNIVEYNEENNVKDILVIYSELKPNLNIRINDISVNPLNPGPGGSYQVNATFRNDGQVAVTEPFDITWTLPADGQSETSTVRFEDPLNAGATASTTFSGQYQGPALLTITLDSANEIDETIESDNQIIVPLCPDFMPIQNGPIWNGNFYINTNQNFSATIRNLGQLAGSDVKVAFYVNDVEVGTTVIPTVNPTLTSLGYKVSIPYVFTQGGMYELKVVVDPDNSIEECNEENNVLSRVINVLSPLADLRILSQYISPTNLNPDANEPVSIFLSFDNIGVIDAGPFKVRLTVDDVPLGDDVQVDGLQAGKLTTVAIPSQYSSPLGGTKVIRGIVDVENAVMETTKANNEATRAIIAGGAPNLLFTGLSFSQNCPFTGDQITINAMVKNEGQVGADAQVQFYYISGQDTIPIESRNISVNAGEVVETSIQWAVVNPAFTIYAKILNSTPEEYNILDNDVSLAFCQDPVVTFTLTTNVTGQGIIARSPMGSAYEEGAELTLLATPATGWKFVQWEGDVQGEEPEIQILMDSDKVVTAVFELIEVQPNTFFLSLLATPDGAGTLEGAGEYEEGDEVAVSASASEGFTFVNWMRDGEVVFDAPDFSYTMPAEDVTLVANFEEVIVEPETFMLSLVASPEDAGTLIGGGEYQEGTEVQISASANEGFTFLNWTHNGNVVSLNPEFSFTMPAEDVTLVANFEEVIVEPETFILTLMASPEGAGILEGGGEYTAGTEILISAMANEGYYFLNWNLNDVIISASEQFMFTMPAEYVTLVANFEELIVDPETFILILESSPEEAGNVSGGGEYQEGAEVQVSASANEGYTFVSWTWNEMIISASEHFMFTMPAEDVTLVANFEELIVDPETFMLTLESSPQDGGIVSGDGEYTAGTEVLISAMANEGYYFMNWTLNEMIVSFSEQFMFTMPAEDVTLVAQFMMEAQPGYCAFSQGYWFAKPDVVWPFDLIIGGRTFTQQQGQAFWPSNTPLKRAFTQYAAVALSQVNVSEFPDLQAAMQVIDNYFATTYPRNANGQVNRAAGFIGDWIDENHCYDETKDADAPLADSIIPGSFIEESISVINAFPNPFREKLNFLIMPENDTEIRLELHDIKGTLLDVVFSGHVRGGELHEIEYRPGLKNPGLIFYRLIMDDQVLTGKLIFQP